MRSYFMAPWALLLLLLLLLLLTGCGGGRSFLNSPTAAAGGQGRASLTITWPARTTRLVPDASTSIGVVIKQGAAILAQQTLARPASGGTSTINFPVLPTGALSVTATAYPNADATGVAQAAATLPLIVTANQTTHFSLTMSSTIDHLDITPVSASVSVGATLAITATAKDAVGAVVLLTPSKLQWLSDNVAIATVDASGIVTGVAIGSANIRVMDPESGKSSSVGVTVTKSNQTFVINGKTYRVADPQETVTVQFTQAEGGVTVSSYQGYVLLNISGVGVSYANVYNDAFYLYTDQFAANPQNGHDGGFYQLAFGTTALMTSDLGNIASHLLVDPVPAYNATHNYSVLLNTTLSSPGLLHFGVSDAGFSDNSGAYTVLVTQLVPVP